MKKIYMLLFAVLAFAATAGAQVLIDTDFSDMDPVPANGTNNLSGEAVAISNGTMFWHGSRYNDTSNTPFIGEVGIDKEEDGGDAVEMSPDNPDVRYIRTGSNPVITDGKPTNHYFQVTPDAEFVNGGKVSLTISVHSTGKGINVYDATDGVLLGTIDISQAVKYKKEVVEFTLPEDFSGVKTLAFTRADVDGELAGVTFFTWHIKIETNVEEEEEVPTSISTPAYEGRVVSTQYYNINGMKVDSRFEALPAGIYIEVSRYENGAVATKKIIKGNR